jgi:hypothetical protein
MRYTLNLVILIAVFPATFAVSSCNQAGNKEKAVTNIPVNAATDSQSVKQPEAANPIQGDLDFLKALDGKYPYAVKLLDNAALQSRLKNLLGNRFAFVKKTWAVETPIEVKNNVFVASGCQAHNCSSTNFIIVVDLTKNKMYAGIREEEKVKTYSEDGTNPPQLNDWANNK